MSKCLICGSEKNERSKGNKYICVSCHSKIDYANDLLMVDKAINILKKSANYSKYKSEIDGYVEKMKIKLPMYEFGSAYEIAVAIQLDFNGVKYIPQYKIGDKRVDFYIPDMDVCIEIDGEMYHKNYDKDFLRDRYIRYHKPGVEIIHINTSNIPLETWNLKNAIPYVIEKRIDDKRVGNYEYDEVYLAEFLAFESYLRKANHE